MPKGKNKKVVGLMKDELGRQIMKEFVWTKSKTIYLLKDSNEEDKKARKRKLKFRDYKEFLEAAEIENKMYHSEKK